MIAIHVDFVTGCCVVGEIRSTTVATVRIFNLTTRTTCSNETNVNCNHYQQWIWRITGEIHRLLVEILVSTHSFSASSAAIEAELSQDAEALNAHYIELTEKKAQLVVLAFHVASHTIVLVCLCVRSPASTLNVLLCSRRKPSWFDCVATVLAHPRALARSTT